MLSLLNVVFLTTLVGLCQMTGCPTEDGYRYDATSGMCVIIISEWKASDEAMTVCEDRGDRLLKLDTPEKTLYAETLSISDGSGFWAGARKMSGVWKWSDSTLVTNNGWAITEPHQPDGSGDCMVVAPWYGHKWDDAPCGDVQKIACERVLPVETPSSSSSQITPSSVVEETTTETSVLADIDPQSTTEIRLTTSQELLVSSDLFVTSVNSESESDTYSSSSIQQYIEPSSTLPVDLLSMSEALPSDIASLPQPPYTDIVTQITPSSFEANSHQDSDTPVLSSSISQAVLSSSLQEEPTTQFPIQTISSTSIASSSVISSRQCECSCALINVTSLALELMQAEIRRRLIVDKTQLSSTKARLTSAPDSRKSSVTIGSVGIAFFVLTFGLIVLGDFRYLWILFCEKKKKLHR